MARLSPAPVLRGHWKGLSQRTYRGAELVGSRSDWCARAISLTVPAAAAVLTACFPPRIDAPTAFALALTWAALVSAGLLGTFALLAGWRAKLSERGERDRYHKVFDTPLRSLLDEAVSHVLLGVLDSLALVAVAAVGFLVRGAASVPAAAIVAFLFTHTLFLFLLVATRVYSAYAQAEEVPAEVDGFTKNGAFHR